ncbi:MAG: hypothetical protein GC160_10695 [Acidobacteria bacterium]|nr:hypothetical protein [Acidobacteriota bacterium]
MKLYPWLLAAALTSSGCFSCIPGTSDSSDEPGDVTSEGVDVEKNPLGALGALAGMGAEVEKMQKELEEMEPVDPLHFSELIKALPDAPSGWTASEPKGSTSSMGGMQVSQASRSYTQDGGESTVNIEVSDWAFNRMIYLPFIMAAKFSEESTEGYNKGITVGDDPGRQEYRLDSKSGERQVLYHKRYHVKIDINNLPDDAFQQWWERVNVSALPEK